MLRCVLLFFQTVQLRNIVSISHGYGLSAAI